MYTKHKMGRINARPTLTSIFYSRLSCFFYSSVRILTLCIGFVFIIAAAAVAANAVSAAAAVGDDEVKWIYNNKNNNKKNSKMKFQK